MALPNTFANNTPFDADEVNENFDVVNYPLLFLFGSGMSGNATISSNDSITAPKEYNNLTINNAVTLSVDEPEAVIRVKGTLTLTGNIASTNSSPITIFCDTLTGAGDIIADGTTTGGPQNAIIQGVTKTGTQGTSGTIGTGAADAGDGGAGGSATTVDSLVSFYTQFFNTDRVSRGGSGGIGVTNTSGSNRQGRGGGGGSGLGGAGGAGGDGGIASGSSTGMATVPDGGGGGAAGGLVFIVARDVSGYTGTIYARGEDGTTPAASTGAGAGGSGGGGGGGGGLVISVAPTPFTAVVTGGAAGSGAAGSGGSPGSDGVAGDVGSYVNFVL